MPNLNVVTARAEKTDEMSLEKVQETLASEYPEYRVAELLDLGDSWEATLEREFKVSEKIKESEFPLKEKKEDDEEEVEVEADDKEIEVEVEDDDDEEEEKEAPKHKEPKNEEEKLETIEQLVHKILDKVKALEEKAGLVDEFHEKAKPHVEEAGPSLDEIGPTAPGGANPGGMRGPGTGVNPMSGGGGMAPKKPPVPRRPYVPSGKPDRRLKNPAQRGMPSAFSKTVYASMQEGNRAFSLEEAVEAIKEQYPSHRLVSVTEDLSNRRYIGKLEKK